jgi:hypothetical protein
MGRRERSGDRRADRQADEDGHQEACAGRAPDEGDRQQKQARHHPGYGYGRVEMYEQRGHRQRSRLLSGGGVGGGFPGWEVADDFGGDLGGPGGQSIAAGEPAELLQSV